MKRTVTIVDAASGASADVRLDATGRLADALPELVRLTGARSSALTRGGQPLDPRQPATDLRDGDVLVLGAAAAPTGEVAVRVEVTAGPGAGRLLALAPGRHVLGRDSPARGEDPLMSRQHVEVVVGADGAVSVEDLHSTNGGALCSPGVPETPLDAGAPTPWPPEIELRIGGTRLVHGRLLTPAATVAAGDGRTIVNRPPRLRARAAAVSVEFPALPQPSTSARLPLLASVAPLAAGVVLALVLRRWEFLAFAVMSPVVVLGQALSDRWAARRGSRKAVRAYAAALAAAETELAAALTAEAVRRHTDAPDLAALVVAALERTALLWSRGRDDDALTVRLGLGALPSTVSATDGREAPLLPDVPVCLDLATHPFVGICGHEATAVARSIAVQVATLCGPADVDIVVLAPGRAAQWAWVRWLPHARVAVTPQQLRRELEQLATTDSARPRLVVADNVTDHTIAATLAERPSTSVVWVGSSDLTLPAPCVAVVSGPSADGTTLQLRTGSGEIDGIRADVLPHPVADQVSRALAPLRDGATMAALPASVSWAQLHAMPADPAAAADALRRRWSSGPSTVVCLGMTAAGPFVADLQADGPHVLVAGTTGAGKSELLQTLVASLATASSPADLNLLLVDFKGGAAFGSCAELPHTVGVMTDLDGAATSRAIASLTAELRRRERVLASVGAADVDAWRARAGHAGNDADPLPRLVIVVDEFATLAEELPDFVGGLVGIAQRGRSLGVHLVLATQRPEGAVSADIRANTRLRICLAVARDNESRDVIDSPRAVSISRTTPGRALVRIGAQDLVEVQTARVAGPPVRIAADDGHRVEVVSVLDDDRDVAADRLRPEAGTELDLLVRAAVAAADGIGARVATPPWLPPLPSDLPLSALPADETHVAIGLLDLPDSQAQPALHLTPDACDALLVVGGPRSGRSTAAVTAALALAAAASPDRLHMWAVDAGNALGALRDLPHTGAVVDVRDGERVDRLLTFLAGEVERRRSTPDDRDPRLLLVVDSWDALVAATAEADAGRAQELLLRLLAQGPSTGVRVVVTTDRSGLTSRLSSAVPDRICLRLPDAADYSLLGLPARRVPSVLPPGRGIRAGDLALVQIAAPDEETADRARRWPPAAHPPRRFDALPARVPLHTLGGSGHGLIMGLRGDDLAPAVVDPVDAGGAFLVAGPPRSGRSTALVSIAAQLRDRPVVALCARPGPLRRRRDLALVADPGDADATRAALAAVCDGATLLVDDVDLLDDATVLDGIEAAVRRARDGDGFVVLAGTTEAMSASFRGPIAQARRGRTGLLLRPDGPHDGELLGVRLRRRSGHADPPGRGVLALHGQVVPVQVPDPA